MTEQLQVICQTCGKILFTGTQVEIRRNVIYCEECASVEQKTSFLDDYKALLERYGFDYTENFFGPKKFIWSMTKDRSTGVNFIICCPDEDGTVEEFEEALQADRDRVR